MIVTAAIFALVAAVASCNGGDDCCVVCESGKACGDTCISRESTCHVGAGCACNGLEPYDDEQP